MYIKPQLMAENDPSIQHANRQTNVALGKTLNHMNKLEKQAVNRSTMEQKLIRRRLRQNLERSLIKENTIRKMKAKLNGPETSEKPSTIHSIKTAWEESKYGIERRSSTPSSCAIVPVAIRLLTSNGYVISDDVIQKYVQLRKYSQKTGAIVQSQSLPNLGNGTMENAIQSASKRKHRLKSESASSESSCRSTKRKVKRKEGDVEPVTTNFSRRTRPITAPVLRRLKSENKMSSIEDWVTSLRQLTQSTTDVSASDEELETPADAIRVYEEHTDGLNNLHSKLNHKMEEINLVDIHRAQIASRGVPRRITSLMTNMESYRMAEEHRDSPGISLDYYSHCMQREMREKKTCDVTETSCLITSLSSMTSSCLEDDRERDRPISRTDFSNKIFKSKTVTVTSRDWLRL